MCIRDRSCIEWLIKIGVPFTKNDKNEISLTLEAAHSERRIVHIDDETGSVLHKQLYEKVLAKKNIEVLHEHQIIDVISKSEIVDNNKFIGAYVFDKEKNNIQTISAKSVVLATGGASKIYQFTSNPNTSTGDGIACLLYTSDAADE